MRVLINYRGIIALLMRLLFVTVLFLSTADATTRPQEWKAINYAPRGHPYFRMLYDWFSRDAASGLEVRAMADADLAMLRRSGFNAVHLYLWDQPTFYDSTESGRTGLRRFQVLPNRDPRQPQARNGEA